MMICTEFDEALRTERARREEQKISYIMNSIEKFPDILDMRYNKIEKSLPKEKTILEEIIDNVFTSVKELSPYITYHEVKQQVTDYITKNSMLVTM